MCSYYHKSRKNIKCNISCILRKDINNDKRDVILSTIQEICSDISQMTVKASQLCRLMMEMMLDANWHQKTIGINKVILNNTTSLEWPNFMKLKVFKDLLIVGTENNNNNITPAVEYAWNKYQSNLLPDGYVIRRRFKDQTFIKYCAITYQSAVLNNLKQWFTYRQKLAIETFLENYYNSSHQQFPLNDLVYALQCLINRWRYKGKMYTPSQLERLRIIYDKDLIQKHWQHLPFQNINVQKLQPFEILCYYYFLKKEYGHMSTKLRNFALIPQNQIRIHHVTFDTIGVQCLKYEVDRKLLSLKKENELDIIPLLHKLWIIKSEEEEEEDTWKSIFNMEYISNFEKKRNITFDRRITTDGLNCTIKYFLTLQRDSTRQRRN